MGFEELSTQLLEENDWRLRRGAARKLGRSEEEDAPRILVDALDDPDPDVLAAVIEALTRLEERGCVHHILRHKIMHNDSSVVRWMAVRALRRLGSEEALETLSTMLDDEEWVVSNEARAVLTDRITSLSSPEEPRNLSVLLRLLTAHGQEVRDAAIGALGEIPQEQAGELLEALEIPSTMVREGIVRALGLISPRSFLGPLLIASRDEAPEVRRAAAWSMSEGGDSRTCMRLAELLEDNHHEVVEAAMESLSRRGECALESLLVALNHCRSGAGKANILKMLGRSKNKASLLIVIEHMSDSRFMVRNAAREAALAFGKDAVEPLVEMIQKSTSPIGPILAEAIGGPSRRVRRRAIRAIGELGNHLAVESLKQLAKDEDMLIAKAAQKALQQIGCAAWGRASAAEILGQMEPEEKVVMVLVEALKDPSHHVRASAIRALGRVGEMGRYPGVLRQLLEDPYEDVRAALALALQLSGSAVPQCAEMAMEALQDESRLVRARAARALGRLNDPVAAPALAQGLQDRLTSVRRACKNALMNMGEGVVEALLETLVRVDEETGKEILEIIEAVASLKSAPRVEAVVSRLEHSELANEAARIASRLKERG